MLETLSSFLGQAGGAAALFTETQLLWAYVIAIGAGFFMAWSIGANDVANAMGTSVGSGGLTLRNAIIVAAIFEFLGAFSSVNTSVRPSAKESSPLTNSKRWQTGRTCMSTA